MSLDLAAELGADLVDESPARCAAAAVDGLVPRAVVAPRDRDGVCRAVAAAERHGLALIPRGGGTGMQAGAPPARYDLALESRGLDALVRHDAADLTVTVEAGVTLACLEETLRAAGQWLPLDPPGGDEATVGGLLAADRSGGLRFSHGRARDYLIGVRAVTGGGALVRGGGEVVKNVAGYDLPKLLIGSFGTLGVIVEATFKVRPRPPADVTVAAPCASLEEAAARVEAIVEAPLAPFAVDLCDGGGAALVGLPKRPHVLLRLGGETAEVTAQRERAAGLLPGAEEVGDGVVRAARDFALGGDVVARLALLPGDLLDLLPAIVAEGRRFGVEAALLGHAAVGVMRLRCDGAPPVAFLRWLRFLARRHGGHLIVERAPLESRCEFDPWGEPAGGVELMRRVKQVFDPHGIFSPGRVPGSA